MNLLYIVISFLVSVICIILAFIQFYNLNIKKITSLRRTGSYDVDPVFRDLIISPRDFLAIDYQEHKDNVIIEPKTAQSTDAEIEQCLKAATTYKESGKLDKALKLFEYAVVLAPENPNVLNKYGEFLERYQKDIVKADELYSRALSHDPIHAAALSNSQRTADIVDQYDLMMFKHIDAKRQLLKAKMRTSLNTEKKKHAFYLHIYHTVGIEGNTMTLEQLQYLLETGNVVNGKSILEHNEILGLDIALRYVKILANTKFIEIGDILDIHRRVMGYADPLTSGAFRDEQVFVGSHVPPPPEDLSRLMDDYVEWLNSHEANSMHPLRLAALAHYKLVDIHPFADGNGRTSRLIMNLILLRSGYPPVIIYKEDRLKYYECLTIANKGDVRQFVRFIAYCTDETLNTYLELNNRLALAVGTKKLEGGFIEMDGIRTV